MDDNILDSIKNLLGINIEDKAFDQDIMMNINSVFVKFTQLGINVDDIDMINEKSNWSKVFYDYLEMLGFIKQYVFLNVRILFDPPTSSFVLSSINDFLKELEWRILVQVEDGTQYE